MPLFSDDIAICQTPVCEAKDQAKPSIEEVSMIGIDLAKNRFKLRGATTAGSVAFWKNLALLQFGGSS